MEVKDVIIPVSIEILPKENREAKFQFQNFIKGNYNQGRKNLLSTFLKRKCRVLLRNKISKTMSPLKIFKQPSQIQNFSQIYPKLRSFIEHYYDKNKSNILKGSDEKTPHKLPYSLLEDIKLFLVIDMGNRTKEEEWFDDGFESMIKQWGFLRTLESLRDRYKRFLKKMTIDDWIKVIKQVEFNGLEGGIIHFDGPKNDKKFQTIDFENNGKMNGKNKKISEQIKMLKSKLCKESEISEKSSLLERKESINQQFSEEKIVESDENNEEKLKMPEKD